MHSHINLLNLDTFNSVVALTNPNFESKYLAKFEAQLTEEFAQLEALLRAKDWEPAERLAHHCKGICDTMGAEALSKRLSYIERACHPAKPGPVQEIIDQLPGLLEETCAQMKQLLRDLP